MVDGTGENNGENWDNYNRKTVLKKSNHPLLALKSPPVDPSLSFCFKLSYNDFAFS